MRFTLHSRHRMARRGIPQRLVDFALQYGRIEGDRAVLDRQETKRIVEKLQAELRVAMHVLDKGGVTVVADEDTVITAWNRAQPAHRRRRQLAPFPVEAVQ